MCAPFRTLRPVIFFLRGTQGKTAPGAFDRLEVPGPVSCLLAAARTAPCLSLLGTAAALGVLSGAGHPLAHPAQTVIVAAGDTTATDHETEWLRAADTADRKSVV